MEEGQDIFEDPVTFTIMEDAVLLKQCGHSLSKQTVDDLREVGEQPGDALCPSCNTRFNKGTDVVPNWKLREAIEKHLRDIEAREKLAEEEEDRLEEQNRIEEERQQIEEARQRALEESRRAEEERQRAEEERRRAEEERRRRKELSERIQREARQREEAEQARAQLEAENQRLAAETARLAELQKQHERAIEEMRQQQVRLQREREEHRLAAERERQRLEADTRERSAQEQQLQREREALMRRREQENRAHIDALNRKQNQTEGELQRVLRQQQLLQEEARKTQEQLAKWSMWDFLPSVPLPVPSVSWGLSWIWGASTPKGKLVHSFHKYRLMERRGARRDSPVFRAVEKEKGDVVALKLLPYGGQSRSSDLLVFREAMYHYHLAHSNLLKLKGMVRDENTNQVYMVLPFFEYDLDHALERLTLNIDQLRWVMHQLLLTISYLHSANIVHRDIQPRSIMISHDGKARIWLTSLGKARNLRSKPFDILPPSAYLCYRAPEVILTAPHLQKSLDDEDWKAADVWSCGCIMAQILFKEPLFVGRATDHDDILVTMLSYTDCRETLGDMLARFPMLTKHEAIKADPTRSLHQRFEDLRRRAAAARRRRRASGGGGSGRKQSTRRREIRAEEEEDEAEAGEDLIDLHDVGSVELMDDDTREHVLELLSKMLTFDPAQRISAEEALNHPFFSLPKLEEMRLRRPQLWRSPDALGPSLVDKEVQRFLDTDCAGLFA